MVTFLLVSEDCFIHENQSLNFIEDKSVFVMCVHICIHMCVYMTICHSNFDFEILFLLSLLYPGQIRDKIPAKAKHRHWEWRQPLTPTSSIWHKDPCPTRIPATCCNPALGQPSCIIIIILVCLSATGRPGSPCRHYSNRRSCRWQGSTFIICGGIWLGRLYQVYFFLHINELDAFILPIILHIFFIFIYMYIDAFNINLMTFLL